MQVRLLIHVTFLCFCFLQRAAGGEERTKDGRFVAFDIQTHANRKLDDDFHTLPGNNLKLLPRGRQRMADVDFFIGEKFIQLAGKKAPDHPEKVEGIAINREVTKLHFLHGVGWRADDGAAIGDYFIHYQDKSTIRLPIEYGRDVKDWWLYEFEKEPTRAVLAWKGLNHASKNFQGTKVSIGLFRIAWENPRPEQKVVSVDYVSRNETMCSPFLIAVTGESEKEVRDFLEHIDARATKSKTRNSAPSRDGASAEETDAIEELRRIKALLEFDDEGRVTSVAISGPGLLQDVVRGSNQTLALVSNIPTIEGLDLSSSSINDEGLETLKNLTRLCSLSLNLTSITDNGLKHLKGLKSLERLRLHQTMITNEGIVELSKMTKLKVLDLSRTKITDTGVVQLKPLELLEELDVRNTQVTASGAASLNKLLPNVKILR